MNKAWKHFKTITYHKYLVAKGCFKIGLYKQGILHDMSKYAPSEFLVGLRYFQGNRSPNNAEREEKGYSAAWLHHKGRNKHHYEYWQDYSVEAPGALMPVPMPDKYFAEMIIDRMAASKVYNGERYTDAAPLQYFRKGSDNKPIHPETAAKLEAVLLMLAERGEGETLQFVRDVFVKHRKQYVDLHQKQGVE